MRYNKISTDSYITLRSEIRTGNSPAKAINEAIEFVKEHELDNIDLVYDGFTMYIDSEVDVKKLVSEFYHWRFKYKKKTDEN
jgi:F0F1-type ATP synthase gamma subunit